MFAKKLYILIAGHAGVGKTTFARMLYNIYKDEEVPVVMSPFAFKLKRIALTGGWDAIKNEGGRKLLVDIGRVFREYDIDTWVKFAIDRPNSDIVIIDDWRYPNESEFIKSNPNYDVMEIRVICKNREILSGNAYNNDSETSLDDYTIDCKVYNTGSMFSLERSAVAVVKTIDHKFKQW